MSALYRSIGQTKTSQGPAHRLKSVNKPNWPLAARQRVMSLLDKESWLRLAGEWIKLAQDAERRRW
jgi:hypothetical protein